MASEQYSRSEWDKCRHLLQTDDQSQTLIDQVYQHISTLIGLLIEESRISPEPPTTNNVDSRPILHLVVGERVFDALLIWCEGKPWPVNSCSSSDDDDSINKNNRLLLQQRLYMRSRLCQLIESTLTQINPSLLITFPELLMTPLLHLVYKLSNHIDQYNAQLFGLLSYELVVLVCRHRELYRVCKQLCQNLFHNPYAMFAVTIPHIHRQDSFGGRCRDALLLILDLSKHCDDLADYLANQSDCCPILATALSAFYSNLPKRLVQRGLALDSLDSAASNGVTRPTSASNSIIPRRLQEEKEETAVMIDGVETTSSELLRFLHVVDLCNLAVKISHSIVKEKILFYIEFGFLKPVIAPALHDTSMDDVVAATAYLDASLRRLTEPALSNLFLQFILTHKDGKSYRLLTTLINRIGATSLLGLTTLSLFRTILTFHSQDVMNELIFKHIKPLLDDPMIPVNNPIPSPSPMTISICSAPPIMTSSTLSSQGGRRRSFCRSRGGVGDLGHDLVKSAELFLQMANLSQCRTSKSSKHVNNAAANGNNCVDDASFDQLVGKHSLDTSNNAEGDESTNSRVFKQANNSSMLQKGPQLAPYLKAASNRIARRRVACQLNWQQPKNELMIACRPSSSHPGDNDSDLELERLELESRSQLDDHQPITPVSQLCPSRRLSEADQFDFTNPNLAFNSKAIASMYRINFVDDLVSSSRSCSAASSISSEDAAHGYDDSSPATFQKQAKPPSASEHVSPSHRQLLDPSPPFMSCTCQWRSRLPQFIISPMDDDGPQVFTSFEYNSSRLDEFLTLLDSTFYETADPSDCPIHCSQVASASCSQSLFPFHPLDVSHFSQDLDAALIHLSTSSSKGDNEHNSPLGSTSTSQTSTATMTPIIAGPPPPDFESSPKASPISCSSGATKSTLVDNGQYGKQPATLGPFLSILMSRLAGMHTNCLLTNLLITELLVSLVAYPCPLLVNLMLNANDSPMTSSSLLASSSTHSLYRALQTTGAQIATLSAEMLDWPDWIERARLCLAGHDFPVTNPMPILYKDFFSPVKNRLSSISNPAVQSTPLGSPRASTTIQITSPPGRRMSNLRSNLALTSSRFGFNRHRRHRQTSITSSLGEDEAKGEFDASAEILLTYNSRMAESNLQSRKLLFGAIIYDEFCYELTAYCLEQSVAF